MKPLTEIRKGCGKELEFYRKGCNKYRCGEYNDEVRTEYCPTCKALLEYAEESEKEHIKELWEAQNLAKKEQAQEFEKKIEDRIIVLKRTINDVGVPIGIKGYLQERIFELEYLEEELLKEVQGEKK